MKFHRLIAAGAAATILAGCGVSEGRYKEVQGQLAKPEKQKIEVGNCTIMFGNQSAKMRQNMAVLAGTSVAVMPTVICKRIIQGVASGKLTREDINSVTNGVMTPNALKIIQGR
ncbi:hypothetical protein [Phyllobacterium myrsinacearum]|uniref:Lipoprotein n=1 Tax=Phyllobacterium myrsinacearum TaxID=28101 RepID=A0A839EPP7_9HYPH|nr:hypothetical protein [Phyllobacterium myrsinacearum]MBA8880802.1 hypothetical protein [Phyllobacterium myrsinacearum]